MRILVTGARGLLGSEVCGLARDRGHEVADPGHAALDVTDAGAAARILGHERPEVVIQCAAFSGVDAAEADPDAAWRVNRDGARIVAEAAGRIGARFVYLSSDYVFDGTRRTPYPPDSPTAPLSEYGRTKAAGEEASLASASSALVVRTSWLFGSARPTFVSTMLDRAAAGEELVIVEDQEGTPSWARDVAGVVLDLVELGATGIRHVASRGSCSWADLAREALHHAGLSGTVRGISGEAWGAPARRPRYSVLDVSLTEKEIGRRLPTWRDALARYLRGERLAVRRETLDETEWRSE